MTNRISSGIKLFAGVAGLVMLGFFINSVVSQLRTTSITATGIEAANVPPRAEDRLLAFTSDQNGNFDIYTIRADGSGLTNLTNNPAEDVNPFWSPDAKHIAFESDRNGFMQIFLMNADGTGLIPLTGEDGQYELGAEDGNSYTPWSPNGDKLIISRRSPGEYTWLLYTIDLSGDKSPLVSEPGLYNYPSWSPNGAHIAFVRDDPQTPGGDQIYVVNADGSNSREMTKSLSEEILLYYYNYYWSPDGQSIFFITQSDPDPNDWTVYEVDLESMILMEKAFSSTRLEDWWEGTSFIIAEDLSTLTWLRSDGTDNTLKPLENCPLIKQRQLRFGANRSSNGNQVIQITCPDDDIWLYYANSNGTIAKQLLNFPILHKEGFITNIIWSPDDQFIAFNITSPDKTDMYILNMEEALNSPSAQPLKMTISGGELFYSPSWQPTP